MKPILLLLLFATITLSKYPYPFCGVEIEEFDIKPNTTHLKQLQVIIRHGARTPIGKPCVGFANDRLECELTHSERPSFNEDAYVYNKVWMDDRNFYDGTCGIGILTALGYNQQVANGQWLRRMFDSFLPPVITREIFDDYFYIRSTDVPRTFLSGESLLTGLYPTETRNEDFEIYVHTMDKVMENLLVNPTVCPMNKVYNDQFLNSALWKNQEANIERPLAKKIAQMLNISNPDEIDVLAQSDCWMSAACNGYGIMKEITEDLIFEAVDNAVFYFGNGFSYPDRIKTAKTGLGDFVNEFYQRFLDRLNGKDEKKFVLYSAHDTTVMPFLIALGIWDNEWPPFGSIITSELHDDGKNAAVRFTYNGQVLHLPGCGEYCPFETFRNLVNQVTPTREDCQVPGSKPKKTDIYSFFQ